LVQKRKGRRDRRLRVDFGSELIESRAPFDMDGRDCRRLEFVGAEDRCAGNEQQRRSH
jgi:hypothetical protein